MNIVAAKHNKQVVQVANFFTLNISMKTKLQVETEIGEQCNLERIGKFNCLRVTVTSTSEEKAEIEDRQEVTDILGR